MIIFGKRKIQELEDLNRELSEKIASLRIKLIAANVKIALLRQKQSNTECTSNEK